MDYQLAILIPTLYTRADTFKVLETELLRQKALLPKGTVQIMTCPDNGEAKIGHKRNVLMTTHKAKYHCFVDDDDMVCDNFIELLLAGISTGADCCSLMGEYYTFDKIKYNYDRPFYHSLKYDSWHDDALGYYRYPNHLNCVRTDLVRDVLFEVKNFGEDHDWSKIIHSLGRLKTEAEIPFPIYKYYFNPFKHEQKNG